MADDKTTLNLNDLKKAVDQAIEKHGGEMPVKVSTEDEVSFSDVECSIVDTTPWGGLDNESFYIRGNL